MADIITALGMIADPFNFVCLIAITSGFCI